MSNCTGHADHFLLQKFLLYSASRTQWVPHSHLRSFLVCVVVPPLSSFILRCPRALCLNFFFFQSVLSSLVILSGLLPLLYNVYESDSQFYIFNHELWVQTHISTCLLGTSQMSSVFIEAEACFSWIFPTSVIDNFVLPIAQAPNLEVFLDNSVS